MSPFQFSGSHSFHSSALSLKEPRQSVNSAYTVIQQSIGSEHMFDVQLHQAGGYKIWCSFRPITEFFFWFSEPTLRQELKTLSLFSFSFFKLSSTITCSWYNHTYLKQYMKAATWAHQSLAFKRHFTPITHSQYLRKMLHSTWLQPQLD